MSASFSTTMEAGSGRAIVSVSVVILNFNKSALTLRCLESVSKHIRGSREIIVVDNGSRAPELELLKRSLDQEVRLISLATNLFFGEANNIAAEAAQGRFLLFLNNDVDVHSDIADELVGTFEGCYAPGAVGARLMYPSGDIQEVGGFMLRDGRSLRTGRSGAEADLYFRSGTHIVDYCSAACLLIERDTFIRIGGFDPLFDPAYYEDCDLCFRLRVAGLYVYVASHIAVVHHENTTSCEVWGMDRVHELVEVNRKRFLRRWGDYLEARVRDGMEPSDPWRDGPRAVEDPISAGNGPRVLVRTDRILDLSDHSRAIFECALALHERCRFTLGLPEVCSSLRLNLLSRHFELAVPHFDLVRNSEANAGMFDEVIDLSALARGETSLAESFRIVGKLFEEPRRCDG